VEAMAAKHNNPEAEAENEMRTTETYQQMV